MVNHEESDPAYRAKMLKAIGDATTADRMRSQSERVALIEALCLVAGAVFLRHSRVPYSTKAAEDVAAAAYNGMLGWLEGHEGRN